MNIQKIEQFMQEKKLPKFRLGQIQKAVFQDGVSSFSEITTLSKDLRLLLEKDLRMLSFEVEKVLVAAPTRNATHSVAGGDGQSIKALLKLHDGNLIETVLISPKPGIWSACISCQVGCAMGCRFCATGKMGFVRNLTAEEITDQILFWRQYLKKGTKSPIGDLVPSVGNIVYMGMGEPFNNWQEVSESIKILTDEKLFGFGSRSLSVSTSGIASGIEKMAREFPQVNLAISLHFASDKKRDCFMPVNKKDNLEALKTALKNYFQITTRKVFLEYIMLDGINDTALDAKQLSDFVYSIGNTHLLHVNLIRYNATETESDSESESDSGSADEFKFMKPSSKTRTQLFKHELEKHQVHATIRKSLGDEIKAACGQLAGEK